MSKGAAIDRAPSDVRKWASAACIGVLALVVRVLPWRNVFIDGQTYFTDSDSYYHLRRIAYNVASFPRTLDHDPYLNFPIGAKAIWPQTLDWLLAALVVPFHLAGSEADYEPFLAWLPPVIGALVVILVFMIVRRHFGWREAIAASLVLAVLPAHFWYSQIGFLDHHAVIALTATLLLGSSMKLVQGCEDSSLPNAALQWRGVLLGLLAAFNLAIWPGALLYVALAQAAVLGVAILARIPETRRRAFRSLLTASGAAFVGIAPFCLGSEWPQWGPYSAVVLSNFQPWWFATSTLFALVSLQIIDRWPDHNPAVRSMSVLCVGFVMVGISAWVLPDLGASFGESVQWLGKTDSFQALVGESVPLFVLHGNFTVDIANSRLSYFIYAFPIAIAVFATRWRKSAEGSSRYAFVLWAVVLFGFTLLQKRFFNTFSVALAITFGVAVVRCHDIVRARYSLSRIRAGLLVSAVSLILLAPCLAVYRAELQGIVRRTDDPAPARNRRIEANVLRMEMTHWLRDNTPATRSFVLPEGPPEYGVIASWGEGHFITYEAQRPAVMGNFGDDLGKEHFVLAQSFFTSEPARAESILDELGVRYVVIRSRSESRAMAKALFASDGSRLGRYRLLFEVRPHADVDLASYKIFEFVRGAELVGTAPSRELVKVELDFTTNLGREARFETVALADALGRYRVRLPYATRGAPGEMSLASHYRVKVGARVVEVMIDESAVQQGAPVEGPEF